MFAVRLFELGKGFIATSAEQGHSDPTVKGVVSSGALPPFAQCPIRFSELTGTLVKGSEIHQQVNALGIEL